MRKIADRLPCRILEGEHEIHYPGGGFIEARTADDPNKIRGGGWSLAIFDECRDMDGHTWSEVVRPALMDRRGRGIFISTPRGYDWFHGLYMLGESGAPGWASWHLPSHDNPWLDPEELTLEAFQRDTNDGGSERRYTQEILAEFLPDGGGVLRNVRACSTGAPEPGRPGERYIGFYDTALGVDFNAVAVFRQERGKLVQVYADRWGEVPFAVQQARIAGLRQYPGTLYVDITGTNMHRHASLQSIGGMVGSAVSVRGHVFGNANKEEMTDRMALLLETGGIQLLDPAKCQGDMKVAVEAQIRELEMWSAHKLPSGQVRYAAPGSEHDDSAVACMAAALLAKEGLGADVSQIFSRMHAWG
jgi:hypothetical protein